MHTRTLISGAPRRWALVTLALLPLALCACHRDEKSGTSASSASSASGPLMLAHGLRLTAAPPGDVATLVAKEQRAAAADGRHLLVYVGATWCEPCKRFHDAAERGELDGELGSVNVLAFDLDRDRDRLAAAGYRSQYIPLFAAAAPTGRASGRQIEGGIKGSGAVAQIVPRLKTLLEL